MANFQEKKIVFNSVGGLGKARSFGLTLVLAYISFFARNATKICQIFIFEIEANFNSTTCTYIDNWRVMDVCAQSFVGTNEPMYSRMDQKIVEDSLLKFLDGMVCSGRP